MQQPPHALLVREQLRFAERSHQLPRRAVRVERFPGLGVILRDDRAQLLYAVPRVLRHEGQHALRERVIQPARLQMMRQLVHQHLPHRVLRRRRNGDHAVSVFALRTIFKLRHAQLRSRAARNAPRRLYFRMCSVSSSCQYCPCFTSTADKLPFSEKLY